MVSPYVNTGIPTYLRKAQSETVEQIIDEVTKKYENEFPDDPRGKLASMCGAFQGHLKIAYDNMAILKKNYEELKTEFENYKQKAEESGYDPYDV
jgi:hypothetical protein